MGMVLCRQRFAERKERDQGIPQGSFPGALVAVKAEGMTLSPQLLLLLLLPMCSPDPQGHRGAQPWRSAAQVLMKKEKGKKYLVLNCSLGAQPLASAPSSALLLPTHQRAHLAIVGLMSPPGPQTKPPDWMRTPSPGRLTGIPWRKRWLPVMGSTWLPTLCS